MEDRSKKHEEELKQIESGIAHIRELIRNSADEQKKAALQASLDRFVENAEQFKDGFGSNTKRLQQLIDQAS